MTHQTGLFSAWPAVSSATYASTDAHQNSIHPVRRITQPAKTGNRLLSFYFSEIVDHLRFLTEPDND
ncbi:hypothetical protein [Larkinella sp. VNQ87]|uniref:hypothetical protein n=1 Tax=Larkinella sp. VNQ87 TaxID=3400921 RepID=UPI003C2BDFBA